MLFSLFIKPVFKAYIEIMATYQSVNLSLQLFHSSVWFTEKASLCCTHTMTGAEMTVAHWSWMFDLEVTKEGFSVIKTAWKEKKEFLSSRVMDKEHHICFYLPQQELLRKIRSLNSRREWCPFLRPLLPPVSVNLHSWSSLITHYSFLVCWKDQYLFRKDVRSITLRLCSPFRFFNVNIRMWS